MTQEDDALAAYQALAKIDRTLTQHVLGTITAPQAVERITQIVSKWTDPDSHYGTPDPSVQAPPCVERQKGIEAWRVQTIVYALVAGAMVAALTLLVLL